jgi:5,10-methenyltetrahydromethanopterin hydrogenase
MKIAPNYIVVAFFTFETPYEDAAQRLIQSMEKYDIFYSVRGIKSRGSWLANTNYKPTFMLDMIDEYPELNIVCVDADAEFMAYPELFNELDCDIALHEYHGPNMIETLCGTIFVKNNDAAREILERWKAFLDQHPQKRQQPVMQKILNGNFYRLPAEYCKIFDKMPEVTSPVIVHHQLSRTAKRLIK